MTTGTKIEGLANLKELAKKFEKGELNNATGAQVGLFTTADEALATHNNTRARLHFDGFKAKILGDVPKSKTQESDDASIALALQLQLEDEIALRKEQEEAASLRLAKELEEQEQASANRSTTYRYY